MTKRQAAAVKRPPELSLREADVTRINAEGTISWHYLEASRLDMFKNAPGVCPRAPRAGLSSISRATSPSGRPNLRAGYMGEPPDGGRAFCGGSFTTSWPWYLAPAHRGVNFPIFRAADVGFRCATITRPDAERGDLHAAPHLWRHVAERDLQLHQVGMPRGRSVHAGTLSKHAAYGKSDLLFRGFP